MAYGEWLMAEGWWRMSIDPMPLAISHEACQNEYRHAYRSSHRIPPPADQPSSETGSRDDHRVARRRRWEGGRQAVAVRRCHAEAGNPRLRAWLERLHSDYGEAESRRAAQGGQGGLSEVGADDVCRREGAGVSEAVQADAGRHARQVVEAGTYGDHRDRELSGV